MIAAEARPVDGLTHTFQCESEVYPTVEEEQFLRFAFFLRQACESECFAAMLTVGTAHGVETGQFS